MLSDVAIRVLLAALAAFFLSPCILYAIEAQNVIEISTVGPPQTLYRWETDRCEDEFVPDSPARAFRRADGQIALIATHRENWMLAGRDFASLQPICRSLLRSSEHRSEGLGQLWIQATYTLDGRAVTALISQDLSVETKMGGCDAHKKPNRCWLNNIIAAQSNDMGQTFNLLASQNRSIATLGAKYPEDSTTRFGVFTLSNIVQHDGAYYVIAYMTSEGRQKSGNCLLRNDNPLEPQRWRGWDGHAFTVSMSSGEGVHTCEPLSRLALPNEVRSLSYNSRFKLWIAVFASRQMLEGDAKPVPGFYYAVSSDLHNWGKSKRIMHAPTRPREEQMDFILGYPSLLDPQSQSRNFETIDGDRPVLLYSRIHLDNGRGTMNRDLEYVLLDMRSLGSQR
jgi:hypothetical protein